jgi:hypothetical protein
MTEAIQPQPCTLEDIRMRFDGAMPVNADGSAKIDPARWEDSDKDPYVCDNCTTDFENWGAVVKHLGGIAAGTEVSA